MATYAYRWADGSVSVCHAKNKDEAFWLFDELAPVTRKLILRLKSPLLVTLRPDIDSRWKIDSEGKLGEEIDLELQERCFPHYDKAYWKVMDSLESKEQPRKISAEERKRILDALKKDVEQVERLMDKMPETPDIVGLFPKGLPGQNN
jgi:hypothetical protein